MLKENLRSNRVKQDVSSSSSRRSTKETSSNKQTKEILNKENANITRKSVRLEKKKPLGTPESTEKSKGVQEQVITRSGKKIDRQKVVEKPVSPNMKKKKIAEKSVKQVVVDTRGDKRYETRSRKAGGKKRRRVFTLSKRKRIKTEAGDDDNDKESEEKSSESNSSSSKDMDPKQEKPENSKSGEDIYDSDDDCSEMKEEESENDVVLIDVKEEETSDVVVIDVKKESIESGDEAPVNDESLSSDRKTDCDHCTDIKDLCDTSSSKDRRTCEVAGLAETIENKIGVSRTGTSICIECKLGGNIRYCEAAGCNRCYHISCLDRPVNNVPVDNICPFCVNNTKLSYPLASGMPESIWDTRELEISDAEGLQKQYFVKYKGLAHIHNKWVTETQLLHEAPLLVENYSKIGSMKWSEEWIVPHQLLKKRLSLSLKPLYESQQNTGKVLNHQFEWLVQWQGLDYEQATWESENTSVLDSPKGRNLMKEFEKISASLDDKIVEIPVKLPTSTAGCALGMDNIHLSYVKNLHDAWNKGHNSITFDDQERILRIVLFILSLRGVTLPFLLITTSDSISQWEAMFFKVAPCNGFKIFLENSDEKRSLRLLHVQNEGGQLAFQVLLYLVDAFAKDLNVLKAIKWRAVIVDESQNSKISSHFSHIKSLSTDKRLLVVCGQLGVSMVSYLDVLSLLDCDIISKTELDDISKLKETLSKYIAYECKPIPSKFVEFWVPVQLSNLQLEQYCSTLLSNAMALSSCSKSDSFGTLHNILVSNRKCCDHPYIVDQSLQGVLTKDLEPIKFLDVGIKASGKLQLLDLILPEMRKRQLRVLILFQPLSGSGKDSASIGDILDDFLRQRFGEDSYERVDGVGMIPSKKQAALSNFNNKEMGRFVFLLEHRACLPSIKLSSVDTIIFFDSDWNPANDLRALQRIVIDSQLEQIMVFRLYTSSTLEEKILRLAENNVTVDSKLQNISRGTRDALLMWGATHLFKRLSEFHSSPVVNISSEEYCWKELMQELLNLISHKNYKKDTSKLIITKVQPICGTYGNNLTLTELPDKEEPRMFWRKLLAEKNPCWKYLPTLTPRQRKLKRPQYFEESSKKTNVGNDDVGRKRKNTANIIIEPDAVIPVIEENEVAVTSGDNETSFRDLLKLKISKLCEVLRLSEDIKIMVERFLEYVIENYRVNKEPTNTLHAFLISMCWIGCELLKHKLDWKQSVALANEHLNFICKEEEANSVYEKLEPAKEMFLHQSENQKKTEISKDSRQVDSVVVKVLDADCNKEVAEETVQENEVQRNPETVAETSNQKTIDAIFESLSLQPNEEPSFSLVAENQSNIPQALETTEQVSNQAESNLMNGQSQRSDTQNQWGSRTPNHSPDPLQFELEKFCELKNTVNKFHEAIKLKLKSDHEKELEEMIAQMNLKYEAKRQEAETAFQLKKKEIDIGFNRVVRNKILAETYRSKCNDLSPFDPSGTEAIRTERLQNLHRLHTRLSNGVSLNSPAQSSASQPVTELAPPLQIVNQTAQFFSTTSNRSPSTMASRPPPSNNVLTGTPIRPPSTSVLSSDLIRPSTTVPITTTSEPPSISVPTSTPSRSPSTSALSSTLIRPPSTTVLSSSTPIRSLSSSGPPSTSVPTSTPTRPQPSTTIHTSIPSRPPPSSTIPTSTPTRPPPSTTIPSSSPTRPPPSTTIPTGIPTRPPPSTTIPPSMPNKPPSSTTVPTTTLNKPPPSTTTPNRPPPGINPMPPSSRFISRPPPNINSITPASISTTRPSPNINPPTLVARNPRGTAEIRTPAPHIRPFTPSTSVSHRPVSNNFPNFLQTSARPPQPFPTNHNGHPSQNSSSSPLTSSQPLSSVPVAPPVSFMSLMSNLPTEQHPPRATTSSLPPMPAVSISNTGLYSASGMSEISLLKQSALDLLMDIDKQAGLHQSNYYTSSSSGFPDHTELHQDASGSNDLVCLSDDD